MALRAPAEKPRHDPDEPKIRDAGVSDAEPSDAAADAADAATEGDDAGLEDGGITDPVAASGAERIADVNANVQIKIFTEKIRGHPLAPRIGRAHRVHVPSGAISSAQRRWIPSPTSTACSSSVPQLRDSSEVTARRKGQRPRERVACGDGRHRPRRSGER